MTSPIGNDREEDERRSTCVPLMVDRTASRGFTLVEVLVSVVLLSVGAVVVMQALARVAQATAVAERKAAAYKFAVSKMAATELAARQGPGALQEQTQGSFLIGSQPFRWDVAVSQDPIDPQRRSAALSIRWSQGERAVEQRIDTMLRPTVVAP